VHVAPACVGLGEGSDHFGSYGCNLPLHFCKMFLGLEPMTSWSQDNSFTTALGLPFIFTASNEILERFLLHPVHVP
jgi:hypothetical protein